MKIAVFSDIHGNLPAFEAALRHALSHGVREPILTLGDATGYGPYPDAVVRQIMGPSFINIIGDYDQKVLSKKHRKEKWARVKPADKQRMFAWTYRALSKQSRKFLKNLPETRQVELSGVKILMTHGSPASVKEHLAPGTPQSRLEELTELADADIILCGNSHQAFDREAGGVRFVNPGSIGRPDDGDPRASYAIIEIKNEGEIAVHFHKVPYDIMKAVKAVRGAGLPEVFAQVIRQGMNYNKVVEKLGSHPQLPTIEPNATVTLLTDFGLKDPFIGMMKGVIAEIAPQAKVIDIGHQVSPQNIRQGARMLAESAGYFPAGSVHVAVVDPGVGTERRALAAHIGSYFYVAPDNGLLTLVLQKAEQEKHTVDIVHLDQPQYWLPDPTYTFHGRDIFSPIGAHLANGIPLDRLGEAIDDPLTLEFPQPEHTDSGWRGEVVIVDVFGNLSTNLSASLLPENASDVKVALKGHTIHGITRAFADQPPGTLVALIDSTGSLAIAVVNGSAAQSLNASVGTPVSIHFEN